MSADTKTDLIAAKRTALHTLRLLEATEAGIAQTDRLRGRAASKLLVVVQSFVTVWREAFWEQWRWPERSLLRPLLQQTFELDLAVERERAAWRELVGQPAERGRFVQGEWRRRIENLESLDDAEKANLAASLRARYAMEAEGEAERTDSLRVVSGAVEVPATSLETFRQEFVTAFEASMTAGAREGSLQLGLTADWTLGHPEAVTHMANYAGYYGDRLTKLVSTQGQVEVRKAIIAGLDVGESTADMARRIQGSFDNLSGYEAERIARTEAIRSHMEGRRTTYQTAGIRTVVWITHPVNCCDECRSRHGRRYPVDSPLLPPEPHPHCRCDTAAAPEETAAVRASAFEGL